MFQNKTHLSIPVIQTLTISCIFCLCSFHHSKFLCYRLSDESGSLKFETVKSGNITLSDFQPQVGKPSTFSLHHWSVSPTVDRFQQIAAAFQFCRECYFRLPVRMLSGSKPPFFTSVTNHQKSFRTTADDE